MLVRDMLYRREIREKVSYTESELAEALRRGQITLKVNYLFSDDSTGIYNLYSLLDAGVPFDSLLISSPYYALQPKPEEIVFGQMSRQIEEQLFQLKKDQYSIPLHTPEGWYIFRITDLITRISVNNTIDNPEYNSAVSVLKARKEQESYERFIVELFQDRKYSVPTSTLKTIAVHISDYAQQYIARNDLSDSLPYSLTPTDLNHIISAIPLDSLHRTVITLNRFSYSLLKFFNLLLFDGMKLPSRELETVYRIIQQKSRLFIEKEMLAFEGIRRGYDREPEVLSELNAWKENYLYQINRNAFFNSVLVDEEEAKIYYREHYDTVKTPEEINIIEILTESLEIAARVLTDYQNGADFRTLAVTYNTRESTLASHGEYGYFPSFLYKDISDAAKNLAVGEIAGPLQLPEGYSIIKLIGRKNERVNPPRRSYADLKEAIAANIKTLKGKNLIDAKTVEFANKFGIEINAEAFKALQTSGTNALIIRKLGFGGQITASPLIAPDNDWVERYFKNREIAP
jgi:parvulin-like peptidyl-prolyl isomerase